MKQLPPSGAHRAREIVEGWLRCVCGRPKRRQCVDAVLIPAIAAALDAAEQGGRPNTLSNLLAVIHRDGGHYQTDHGTEKAAEDAEAIVLTLRARVRQVEEALRGWTDQTVQVRFDTCSNARGIYMPLGDYSRLMAGANATLAEPR